MYMKRAYYNIKVFIVIYITMSGAAARTGSLEKKEVKKMKGRDMVKSLLETNK